jgi:hypothetical protein
MDAYYIHMKNIPKNVFLLSFRNRKPQIEGKAKEI